MNVETAEISKAEFDIRAEQSARADRFFAGLVASAGYFVLFALAGAAISMFWGGREAITTFGFDFFSWVYVNGRTQAEEQHYVPLPEPLVKQVQEYWTANFKF